MVHRDGGEHLEAGHHPADEAGDGTRGGKGGVRFVIFSRQRSASTTFVGLLNLHPNVTCRWESFSNSFTASKMRNFLGIANRSTQLDDIPQFMRRFWGACPTSACGFKLLNAQIRPNERVPQIFQLAAGRHADPPGPSEVPVRRLILERANINAEFQSWRRATSTGNWGTSPEAQARLVAAQRNGSRAMFHKRAGCRGCDLEAVAKSQAMANSIGPARFAFQHRAWFRLAYDVAETPLMHLYSENLTSSMVVCNKTMAAVYRFLQLPPLRENCNISSIPIEWPCDIETDPHCSMEKYNNASVHDR